MAAEYITPTYCQAQSFVRSSSQQQHQPPLAHCRLAPTATERPCASMMDLHRTPGDYYGELEPKDFPVQQVLHWPHCGALSACQSQPSE